MLGETVEAQADIRVTHTTAVGNGNGRLNGTPADKSHRDSAATITYEVQLPAICIHQVEEDPVSPELSPSILLASKTIAPASVRPFADW